MRKNIKKSPWRKTTRDYCNSALYWNVYRMRTDPGFFFGKAEGEQGCRCLYGSG